MLSCHFPFDLNQFAPSTQPANFGTSPLSIYPHWSAHQDTKQAHHSTRLSKPYQLHPARLSSLIAYLRQGNLNNRLITSGSKNSSIRIVPQNVSDILRIPITTPPKSGSLHCRKFYRIGVGTSTVICFCPRNITITEVVALHGEFDMFHIYLTFHICRGKNRFQFLNTTLDRIFRVFNSIMFVRILCIETSAACIGSSPLPPLSCILTALISSTYSGIPYSLAYFCMIGS